MSSIQAYPGNALIPSFDHASVADVMHPGVMSCAPQAPLGDVAATMAAREVHAVVVGGVSNDRLVWGVISDMDLLRASEAGLEGRHAEDATTGRAIVVAPDTPLTEAAALMVEHGTSHLVVAAHEQPVGVISSLDIARALAWGGRTG
jgi:CBS domain-containing protein